MVEVTICSPSRVLRECKQNLVCTRTKGKEQWPPQETEPNLPESVLVSPVKAWVNSDLPWGQGHWQQQTWEVWHVASLLLEEVTTSFTIEPPRRQPTNGGTIIPKKFLHCCKSSKAHNRFPNLGIQQKDWELPEKQTLEGHNKALWAPGPRKKEQWTYKRLSHTCLWMSRSLWQRCRSTVVCLGVRGVLTWD